MRLSLAKIGVLVLDKFIDRDTNRKLCFDDMPNHGLTIILSELNQNYEYCHASDIDNFDFVLCSLTSVMDVENLVYSFERFAPMPHKCKVIVGGFGVVNVKLISHYIDIAVFGRGEGQINEIINGQDFGNVWRKEQDPCFLQKYVIRKPQYLCEGEQNVGCQNKCRFCFYSWARGNLFKDKSYYPGKTLKISEDDWNHMAINKPGKYITAWDGWSEATRRQVHKPITDQDIIDKLRTIADAKMPMAVALKIYMVTGYPWETLDTVTSDIDDVSRLLSDCDTRACTPIFIMFKVNPFGAEPLTPMQYDPVNINTKWRTELRLKVYHGQSIRASILPMIDSPYTLLKRMMIHRANTDDIDLFKQIVFSRELSKLPAMLRVPWLLKNGHVDNKYCANINEAAFDYLRHG